MTTTDGGGGAPLVREVTPETNRWRPWATRLTAGVAQVDVTPPVGIRAHNWGASRVEVATGVHQPLTASVLSWRDGTGWRDLVTVDLGWWGSVERYLSVFTPLCDLIGATEESLLLHLVHTHAGPTLAVEGDDAPGMELVGPYRAELIDRLAGAVHQARSAARESVVTWAYGKCSLAVGRDLPCGERDVVGFNPDQPADDTVLVGRVSTAGEVAAVLVNYACHPTTLAHENSLLSPDFIGSTRAVVEGRVGTPCLFFQGASGDLAPRDQYLPGTSLAERNGRSLGYAVLATLETMGSPGTELAFDGVVESGAPLAIWREHPAPAPAATSYQRLPVELTRTPPMTAAQLAERFPGIDPVAAEERLRRATRLREHYADGATLTYPVWIWTMGDAVIVASPGEAFSLLQTELRRRHPDRPIMVLNLTNGPGFMYLPTRASYRRDRYQVWQTLLAEGCLEEVIDVVDAHIPARSAEAAGHQPSTAEPTS
ncbi:hypothetical protein [Phytoactinopolyspora limicola]|uniref:hypothetical protein n=1 Tax=Phytoactinopolyspora limicola TaxID=2715536 RepID=UPI00140B90CF|nr:hypothetical protein [Phytoactinopolyspora limicola]